MRTARVAALHGLAAAVVLGAAWLAAPVRGDEDDAGLRRKALALNDITGQDPVKAEIKALVKDPAGTRTLLVFAGKMIKDKEKKHPFSYTGAYILARAAHELKDFDNSKAFYVVCIEQSVKLLSGEKIAQSYGGLIDLLTEHRKFDECGRACQEFLELPAEGALMSPIRKMQYAVLKRWVQTLTRLGQAEKANKVVDAYVGAQPDTFPGLDLRASILREVGRYEEAVQTYEKIIESIKKDEKLSKEDKTEAISEYRYALSGVYIDLKKVDKAVEMLRALLKEKPDDPTYNNDLGYIMADNDQNLPEAERLIRKAIDEDRKQRKATADLDPGDDRDNAAFLDSLGWVLFKTKKYDEAKKYLLQAVQERDGQHIEILDHLGDVHMALGEKEQAIAIWKKAVQLEPSGRREEQKKTEVEKKLKDNS